MTAITVNWANGEQTAMRWDFGSHWDLEGLLSAQSMFRNFSKFHKEFGEGMVFVATMEEAFELVANESC